MSKHPNQYLNELVAIYVLHYLHHTYWQKTGSPINNAAWNFLERSGISPFANPDTLTGHYLTLEAAYHQKDLASGETFRNIVRQQPHLKPLVAHGPQALLIYSYLPLLENIFELDKGEKRYGYCKEVYREIVTNIRAARHMFTTASKKIAQKVFELAKDTNNLALVEGGAGNGQATLDIWDKFSQHGLFPFVLPTDIDPKTRDEVLKLFATNNLTNIYWEKVDLTSAKDIQKIQALLGGYQTYFMVNFILHEHESIAANFFATMSQGMPYAKLVITEFFHPENLVDDAIPEWFIFLHAVSGQFLRTERKLVEIARQHGYRVYDRLDHHVVNNKPLISTLFLEK